MQVKELLVAQESSGKVIGAICAAPVVLLGKLISGISGVNHFDVNGLGFNPVKQT